MTHHRSRCPWTRSRTASALTLALAAEVGIVMALPVQPALGWAAAALLLLVYAGALRQMEAGASCECFGSWLPNARAHVAARRDVAVAALAAAVALGYVLQWVTPHQLSVDVLGSAAIIGASGVAWNASRRRPLAIRAAQGDRR